jgi:hypothetical protein
MLLGGLWHGAAWTFVIWGAYQGSLLVVERLLYGKPPPHPKRFQLSVSTLLRTLITFALVCYGWLIFRAADTSQLWTLTLALAKSPLSTRGLTFSWLAALLLYGGAALLLQAVSEGNPEQPLRNLTPLRRALVLVVLSYSAIIFGAPGESQFIYFQF